MAGEDPVDRVLSAEFGAVSSTPVELLAIAVALDEDQWRGLALAHPKLLRPAVLDELERPGLNRGQRPIVELWRAQSRAFDAVPGRWEIAIGPVERLWTLLDQRVVNGSEAERLAAQPAFAEHLWPPYAEALRMACFGAARSGGVEGAFDGARALLAACRATPDEGRSSCIATATRALVEVAMVWLADEPNIAVFRTAVAAAAERVAAARAAGDVEELASALSLLGRFRLDAATAGQSGPEFWHTYAVRMLRHQQAALMYGGPTDPPDPVTTVAQSVANLREALALDVEAIRPMTAKALVQALFWQHTVGRPPRRVIRAVGRNAGPRPGDGSAGPRLGDGRLPRVTAGLVAAEARAVLARLDPAAEADLYSFVRAVLAHCDPKAGVPGPPIESIVDSLAGYDPTTAQRIVLRTVDPEGDPERAIALIEQHRDLLRTGDAETYYHLLLREAHAVGAQALAGTSGLRGPGRWPEPLRLRAKRLKMHARRNGWPARRLAAGLIQLAGSAPSRDAEHDGLLMLAQAAALAPDLTSRHLEAFEALRAQLIWGEANNLGNRGRLSASNTWYADCVPRFLALGMTDKATECVDRMSRSAHGDPTLLQELVMLLQPLAADLRRHVGPRAVEQLREVYRDVAAGLFDRPVQPSVMLTLHQLAKGHEFSQALVEPGALPPERGDIFLAAIASEEAALGMPRAIAHDGPFATSEEMLTAYLDEREYGTGATDEDQLRNLRREYDRGITELLHDRRRDAVVFTVEQVRELLDDRTVLISLMQTTGPNGAEAITALAITRQEVVGSAVWSRGELPIRSVVVGSPGEQQLHLNPLAFEVTHLRRTLADKPDFRLLSRDAEKIVTRHLPRYLGHLAARLPQWRAQGKDHLCVWAHGATHYLPFHLLHADGAPLAEHWIVTSLPSLTALLAHTRPRSATGATVLSVAATDGGSAYGLAATPSLDAQAEAVASVFGASAYTGALATRERVLRDIEDVRYLHIAAHGTGDAVAPAFQTLYLHPEPPARDGRVFAHDFVRTDLTRVDLATFSACDTALGRFDLGDNLRGLPASMFAAGCASIVATLWPVEPDPAGTFFTTLYRELAEGRPKLDAFGTAQRETRRHHPHYSDWGAFVFVGDWQQADSRE
ncbi:CHAT domain-containing protein [Micromonospora sp. CPCC 205371]|nr:CHAT domain-containing protein [Micromonospora sp. CPCC 205371]